MPGRLSRIFHSCSSEPEPLGSLIRRLRLLPPAPAAISLPSPTPSHEHGAQEHKAVAFSRHRPLWQSSPYYDLPTPNERGLIFMTEPSRETVRLAQVNEIYQALGQFLVEFSRMVHSMETNLHFAVGGDQQLLMAVTVELTAYPLAQAWRSVMTKATDISDDDRKVLSGLRAEIGDLIELRNNWMHGTWFVGYGNETTTDWSKAALSRFKNTKEGVARPDGLEDLPTADYIDSAAAHAGFVADAISTYGAIATGRRHGIISARPSERVRVTKVDSRRQIEMTSNGVDWRSSEMP